jgi:hypothetical protein
MSKKTDDFPPHSDLERLLSFYQAGLHEKAEQLAVSISRHSQTTRLAGNYLALYLTNKVEYPKHYRLSKNQ